jgi:anthranilate 1,2-dioxygenase small subunit
MSDLLKTLEIERAITSLLHQYARVLDSDQLEEWPGLFTEDGVYKVLPRENAAQNLPVALILCTGRNSMLDRVKSLREANIYNEHYPRHLVSNIEVLGEDGGVYRVSSLYAVYQTDLEGHTRLFSVGEYQDRVVLRDGTARFLARTALCDTFSVPNLLAIPI